MNASHLDFHNHFLNKGGYFDYTQTGLTMMYEFTLKEFQAKSESYQSVFPRFPVLNIGFINNNLFNAVASKRLNQYYVGIYAGTFMLLNELFLRMMSSSQILPEIGDVSKEGPTKKLFNPQQTDLDVYFLTKPEEDIMPKDVTRQLYASLFTKTALNFLFDHEYAHVAFGHVDYLGSLKNIFSFSEIELTDDTPLNTQTLEMDADSYASHQGVMLIKTINDKPSLLPEFRRSFFCNWEIGIANWLFAVYSMFRIFGYKNFDHNNLLKYSHPPTGIRQRLIAGSLYRLLTAKVKLRIEERFYDIHHDVIDTVEKAFNEISETPLNRNAINFAYTPEAEYHIEQILKNWTNMRPKLEPFSFGYLP